MKTPISLLTAFAFGAAAVSSSFLDLARAQEGQNSDTVVSADSNNSTGILVKVNSATMVVKESGEAVTYQVSPDVTVLDSKNQHVKIAELSPGLEVTVYYHKQSGNLVAGRIVAQSPVR